MLNLEFRDVRFDGDNPKAFQEVLLRVVADFNIRLSGVPVYDESDYCVVELAYHLSRWLLSEATVGTAFKYQSMESTAEDLLWFRPDGERWVVGSEEQVLVSEIELGDLRAASSRFVESVTDEVYRLLEVDIRRW